MPTTAVSPRAHAPLTILLAALAVLSCGAARAEPPIRSPQDAACRLEARARVFSTPNPRGLELEEVGRGLYYACMRRAEVATRPARHGRRRHHRHRRR